MLGTVVPLAETMSDEAVPDVAEEHKEALTQEKVSSWSPQTNVIISGWARELAWQALARISCTWEGNPWQRDEGLLHKRLLSEAASQSQAACTRKHAHSTTLCAKMREGATQPPCEAQSYDVL